MIDPFANRLWSDALSLAFRWHSGQTRKSTGLPYVIHCVEVAAMLERLGFAEPVVIGGLLHDILEDTGIPQEILRSQYGSEVFEIVSGMTERKHDEDGRKRAWIDRKRDHINHLRTSSRDVRAVALADQRHNLESVISDGRLGESGFWKAFNASPGDYLSYHRKRLQACSGDESGIRDLAEAVSAGVKKLEERMQDAGIDCTPKFAESDWT